MMLNYLWAALTFQRDIVDSKTQYLAGVLQYAENDMGTWMWF